MGDWGRHSRHADVSTALGPGQHHSGRGSLPAGNGRSGAPSRSHGLTHRAGQQRLLHPRHRRRLPQEDVRYSITIRQHASVRNTIEDIPKEDWTPIPYWMEDAADVA